METLVLFSEKKFMIWNKDNVQNVLELFTHLRTSLISSEFFLITYLLRDFQFFSKTVKIVYDALVIVRAKTFDVRGITDV